MWLDRLAGGPANTPSPSNSQPASRPYSPLPRRTSSALSPYVTSQRVGPSPRSSSLSLVSNDSSASLLSSRKPNGSNLKYPTAVDPGLDSVQVLEALLASVQDDDAAPATKSNVITEDDVEFEADFGGMSLKELAASQTPEPVLAIPRRPQTAEESDAEKTKLEDLHRSIEACDDVLNSVEINLSSFRNDLATVSADIESLQARSEALNRRLDNRKEVEKALGPLVEELSLPPEVITKIASGHMDETWVKMLSELDRRAGIFKKKTDSHQTSASKDLGPVFEKLTLKAIERIRDYLVGQIKALRSPHINAQIIQQQNFLRFKDLFLFLHKHHATLAGEIALAYMNTMRWYYANQFSRYEKALGKIKLHVLDKNDALGHDETSRKATVLSGSRMPGAPHDAFNLGRRIDLLRTKNQAAMSSYLAEEDQTTHYLEVAFRNFNLALVDNATAEYTFMASFFAPALSFSHISKNFTYVFQPTFELGRTLTKALVGETYDALGVLLCIRLNQHFAFELQRRKVPAGDGYINATNMLLWPRLQSIMDRHCESVRALAAALPAKPARAADSAKMSAAPHVVTQRFAQLLHGSLVLSAEGGGDDEPVVASIHRLRGDVEAFLLRQAHVFGADKRKSGRFLYNNYSLILTIISDAGGKLADDQTAHFEKLKAKVQEGP